MSGRTSRGPGGRDDTLEEQNDALLGDLHRKVKQLHAVTLDIHDDARGQNSLLDTTSDTFDSFRSSIGNSATRLARSVQSKQGQPRIIAYCVAAAVGLFIIWRYIL